MSWEDLAFRFGPAEMAALLVLLLTLACVAAPQPPARSAGMAVLGLLLGLPGQDRWGEERDLLGLAQRFDDPVLFVACVGIFALLVPQIARHHLPTPSPASRSQRLWNTAYQCLGFATASGAIFATAGWLRRPAWTGPFATVWCAGLLLWYGWTPDLLGVCAALSLAGLLLAQLDCPVVPMMVGMGVSPALEEQLSRALLLSRGDWLPLALERPTAAGLLALGAVALAARMFWPHQRASGTAGTQGLPTSPQQAQR